MKMFRITTPSGSVAFSAYKAVKGKSTDVGLSRTPADAKCEEMNSRAADLGINTRYELHPVAA